MSRGPWEILGLVSASAVVLFIAAWFGIVLYRAVRQEAPPRRGEVSDRRARVAELEAQRARMAELEERIDFAERLLAEHRSPEPLPRA